MTKENLTSIVLVVDRSGSMQGIAQATEDALKEFVNGQKEVEGELTIDTVFFDDHYEERALFVNPKLTELDLAINPRGMTALFDAVGKKINSFGEKLAKIPEADRPETVLFVIATDGLENSSQEFTNKTVADLIKRQQDKYGWKFTFIGANQDAVLTAESLNISKDHAITFAANAAGTENVLRSMGAYTKAVRGGHAASYSEADRKAAVEE